MRTIFSGKLAAGPQQLVWDGRGQDGSLAFGGSYLVRVTAANAVGLVELTQPFRAVRG